MSSSCRVLKACALPARSPSETSCYAVSSGTPGPLPCIAELAMRTTTASEHEEVLADDREGMARPRRGKVPADDGVLPEDGLRPVACVHAHEGVDNVACGFPCRSASAVEPCAPCLGVLRLHNAISSPRCAMGERVKWFDSMVLWAALCFAPFAGVVSWCAPLL